MSRFVAIDFETADYGSDSACSVALVVVENGKIIEKDYKLICPPRSDMMFTHVHGFTYDDVKDAPPFSLVWPELTPMLENADFMVAHNSPFDSKVLYACCAAAGLDQPATPFKCTVKLARKYLEFFPTKLNNCCERLGIELDHHNALSDAEACAKIMITVEETEGYRKDNPQKNDQPTLF